MDEQGERFDVVVLGAGPGGYVAAIRAAQLGKRVAVVEEKYWGGVCLNVGCIPSKALLRNAELAHIFTHEAKTFGIKVDGQVTFDYGEALPPQPQGRRRPGQGRPLPDEEEQDHGDRRPRHVPRPAHAPGGRLRRRHPHHRLRPLHHRHRRDARSCCPAPAVASRVVTYEEQILAEDLPQSIIIAGAGAIGVEFAYVLHNYGVKVTIVEFLDRMVPLEDAEVSAELAKQYRKLGIDVLDLDPRRVDRRVRRRRSASRSPARTAPSRSWRPTRCCRPSASQPNVDGYGLENTGVTLTERGAIDVDGRCRTNVPHIFAIGDVTAKLMLAHAAEAMGIIAAETIADAETMELDYVMIPRATYCQPQIASFGYTEAQAREKGFDVQVAKFPFTANGKAHGLGDATGFVKLISDAQVRRAARRPPHRPGRHRAAARADPGPAVGPHRPRGRPQRPRPPDAGRGGQGSRPRPRRPHDQHVVGRRRPDRGVRAAGRRMASISRSSRRPNRWRSPASEVVFASLLVRHAVQPP